MEATLYPFINEQKSMQLGVGNMQKLVSTMRAFSNALQIAQQADIMYILDVHYEALSKAKAYIKENHIGNATIKPLFDQIFINRLNMSRNKTPAPITKLFEEFIKGITYFRHQQDANQYTPIYHRFFSCGPGDEIYRNNNLICLENISNIEKKRRRPNIERCYLERLIYDAMYRKDALHFPLKGTNDHSQDQGHIFRLDLTQKDYETCFKGHSVDVEVTYQGRFPITLRIIRKKNGNVLYTEEYTQEIRSLDSIISPYTGFVRCKRILANGITYAKVQNFQMESPWRLLN